MSNKVQESIESIVKCSGKWATIAKISRNPALAATEICTIQDENRHLHHQIACVVLFDEIAMDGAIFPKGTKGNQIRKVVEIFDGPINKLLQPAVATLELELWWVHAKHISKVCSDGEKHQGRQPYHPMLMS